MEFARHGGVRMRIQHHLKQRSSVVPERALPTTNIDEQSVKFSPLLVLLRAEFFIDRAWEYVVAQHRLRDERQRCP